MRSPVLHHVKTHPSDAVLQDRVILPDGDTTEDVYRLEAREACVPNIVRNKGTIEKPRSAVE